MTESNRLTDNDQHADTARGERGIMCGGLVAQSGPRQRKKTTPEAWKAKADEWWAHVADCPDCSQFYEKPQP